MNIMTEPLQTIESPRFVLEQGKPFSQSFIWRLQRAFFEQRGDQAWSEGIESYGEAITYFQRSLDVHGPNRSTWHHMGMAYFRLRQLDEALSCMNESLALDPNYSPAKSMRIKLQAESQDAPR